MPQLRSAQCHQRKILRKLRNTLEWRNRNERRNCNASQGRRQLGQFSRQRLPHCLCGRAAAPDLYRAVLLLARKARPLYVPHAFLLKWTAIRDTACKLKRVKYSGLAKGQASACSKKRRLHTGTPAPAQTLSLAALRSANSRSMKTLRTGKARELENRSHKSPVSHRKSCRCRA